MADNAPVYTKWLLITIAIVTFGSSMLFGYNIASINTPAKIIRSYYENVTAARTNATVTKEWSNEHELYMETLFSLTVSIWVLGGMVGAMSSGVIADTLGRKTTLLVNHSFMFVGCLLQLLAKFVLSHEVVIAGRFFVGINGGITIGVASIYLTEISPKSIRGAVGACQQLLTTVGILAAQVVGLKELFGTVELWPVLLFVSAVPAFISAIVLPFCPESPRFLLFYRRDVAQATSALQMLRGKSDVAVEMEQMSRDHRKAAGKAASQFRLKHLFSAQLRLPLTIAIVLQIAQQLSGVRAVFSFSEAIFEDAGVTSNSMPYWVVATGVVHVLSTALTLPLLERLGRRPLLIYPLLLMMVSMAVLTVALVLSKNPSPPSDLSLPMAAVFNTTSTSLAQIFSSNSNTAVVVGHTAQVWPIVGVICIFMFVFGFSISVGPIAPMMVAELFVPGPLSSAMALAQLINWTCNFILCMGFRYARSALGPFVFLIFTTITAGCCLFFIPYAPETKNRSVEEIAQMLSKGFRRAPLGAAADVVEVPLKALGERDAEIEPLSEAPKHFV